MPSLANDPDTYIASLFHHSKLSNSPNAVPSTPPGQLPVRTALKGWPSMNI